ncbi:MAG: nucleotidyltransferase domain-containing protein [Eubacteriales bacterium]|nr:nucleotidyltransferase domain-containing protein [Eubacteriales bacterium]
MILYPKMKKEILTGVDGSCQVSARHRKAVKKCIDVIREESGKRKIDIEKIILFGSCARSESRYESDIDLLLLVKDIPNHKEIRKLKMKLCEEVALDVDLKISTKDKFKSQSDLFTTNIKRDGVTLWKR